ncbi:MAG: ABC transporter permease [Acidobacteria bacterium]|nr:ABC transporter permease [Acidobacteriota bacterium]
MGTITSDNAGAINPAARAADTHAQAKPAARETPTGAARALPAEPLVTIEPRRSWAAPDLGELWAYRELLYFLAWRDVKVRYKQTALGVVWVVMQPLLMTLIFTVFLGRLARVPTGGVPYPLLVYTGLLPWTFFAAAVTQGASSIVGNSGLITKVYFPRLIIPAAAIAARLVDFAVAFAILFGMMFYFRVGLTRQAALLPALVVLLALLALGAGMLVAALNVRYRDVGVVLPVVVQLWMFVSPVLYPSSLVRAAAPRAFRLYALNPMVGVVDGFRSALLGQPLAWAPLAWAAGLIVALLACSAYVFRRVERSFADVI